MTPDVHVSAAPDRAYTFVLPGTWAQIPLDTPENARAAAQQLVRERVGRDDRLASLRRTVRDDLVATAAQAAINDADGLWLSLEILPGIPLPASMITSLRAWPPVAPDDFAVRLAEFRPGSDILRTDAGPVARTRSTAQSRVDETRQSLSLEYAVPSPSGTTVLVITASAPVIEDAEPYTPLFDAIVDSLRWPEVTA